MYNDIPSSYEIALKELQEILDNIEKQSVSVDVITTHTQRARFLIEHCRKKLRQIETDSEQLLQI